MQRRRLLTLTPALLPLPWAAGCASLDAPALEATSGGTPIITTEVAQGQDSRVLFLVIHYTVANFEASLRILTRNLVSAHYLLSDETPPRLFRLVDESRRAWHSGPSAWGENGRLNSSSVGIEIVHPGFALRPDGERQYLPFPERQIEVLLPLVRDIMARHRIRPERVLGHGEVSPQQKEDPGPTFPWKRLADAGLAQPWPDPMQLAARRALHEGTLPDIGWFQRQLARHGYRTPRSGQFDEATRRVLMNFQMRWRPSNHSGQPDAESAAILDALTAAPA